MAAVKGLEKEVMRYEISAVESGSKTFEHHHPTLLEHTRHGPDLLRDPDPV